MWMLIGRFMAGAEALLPWILLGGAALLVSYLVTRAAFGWLRQWAWRRQLRRMREDSDAIVATAERIKASIDAERAKEN